MLYLQNTIDGKKDLCFLKQKKSYQFAIRKRFYNNFFTFFIMFKLILLITALICLSYSEGIEWTNWNIYTSQNLGLVHAYQKPSLSSNFSRLVDNTLTHTSYQTRANQYKYTYTVNLMGTCNIYCGLRSFLTNQNGFIICQRDMSSSFWGGLSGYNQTCIPDVDRSLPCKSMNIQLGSVGRCDQSLYAGTSYKNIQCCYNDNNPSVPQNPDITTRTPDTTTSYFALRLAE